jgi:hypothetical protein
MMQCWTSVRRKKGMQGLAETGQAIHTSDVDILKL